MEKQSHNGSWEPEIGNNGEEIPNFNPEPDEIGPSAEEMASLYKEDQESETEPDSDDVIAEQTRNSDWDSYHQAIGY